MTPQVSQEGVHAAATAGLAEFVARTRWQDIPADVKHEAKRSLVNFFACSLGGCNDPAIAGAWVVLREFSAGEQATVIGRVERTDMLGASFFNAMSANVFDFDDTHVPTIIHPTAPVAPPLFALSQTRRLSGEQLLLAFVLGVEVECRIGNAVSPGHYKRGWHITSTCGVFGAAAAAGKALMLSSGRLAWALGNASVQACGLVESLGTMSKSLSVGNAARNGLLSALLAQQDYSGPDQPLEGERGFLRVTADNPDIGGITKGLGDSWELLANTYKPYPCGVVLNPVLEACLALAGKGGFALSDIRRIEITGHPLLRERTDRPRVRSGRESQVSAQHGVAVALTRGRAGLVEFSDQAVADPELRTLGDKVSFVDDAGYRIEAARVALHLASGATLSRSVSEARGSSACPLTDGDLEQKLEDLALFGGSGCAPRPLIAALWDLEASDDAGSVMRLAAPASAPARR